MKTVTKNFRTTSKKEFIVTAKRGYENETIDDYENGGFYAVRKPIEETDVKCVTPQHIVESGSWDIHTRVPAQYAQKGVVAIFAKKVGLFKEEYERLKAAIQEAEAEAETDENWQEYVRSCADTAKMEAEYEEFTKFMEKAMDF